MGGCFSASSSGLPRGEDVRSGSHSSAAAEYRARLYAEPPSRSTASGIGSPIGRIVSSRYYVTDPPSGTSRVRSTVTIEGGPQPALQLPVQTSGAYIVSPSTAESVLSLLPEPGLPACILAVGGSATSLQGNAGAKPNGARRLVPVWGNAALMEAYRISSVAAYSKTLQKLASRDPLLVYVLQKCVNALGTNHRPRPPTLHVTADPAAPSPELLGLRITACWWQGAGDGVQQQQQPGAERSSVAGPPGAHRRSSWQNMQGQVVPALILQHGAEVNTKEVVPRILRDYFTLSLLPTCTTVLTFDGKVLYQNAASLAYLGEFMSFDLGHQVPQQSSLPAGGSVLSGNSASGVCVPLMHERNARSSLAGLIGMRRSAPHTAVQPPAGQEPGEPQGITLLTEALGPEHPRPQTAGAPSVLPPEQEEPSPNVLRLLFLFDPGALEEALEGISSTSSSWTGVVQVPHNLKRHLRAVARHQAQNAAALAQLAAAGYANFSSNASVGESGSNIPLIMGGIRQGSETSGHNFPPAHPIHNLLPAAPSRLRSSTLSSAGQAATPSLPGSQVMALPIVAPGSPAQHAQGPNLFPAAARNGYSRLSSGPLPSSGTLGLGAPGEVRTGTSLFLSMLGAGGGAGEIAALDLSSSQLRQAAGEGSQQPGVTNTTAEHQAILADPYLGVLMEGLGSFSGLAPVVEDVEVDLAIESLQDEDMPDRPQSPGLLLQARGSHDPSGLDGRLHPVIAQALSPRASHAAALHSESGVPPRAGSPGLVGAGSRRTTGTLLSDSHSALLAGVGGPPVGHASHRRKSSSWSQQPQYVPPAGEQQQQQQHNSRSPASGDRTGDKPLAAAASMPPPSSSSALHQQRLQQSAPVLPSNPQYDHSGKEHNGDSDIREQSSSQQSPTSQQEEEGVSSGDGYDEDTVLAPAPRAPGNRPRPAPPERLHTAELHGGTSGLDHLSAAVASGGQGGHTVELSVNRSFILPRSVASVLHVIERKRAAGAHQQQQGQQGPPTPGAQPGAMTGLRSRASIGAYPAPQLHEDQGDIGRQQVAGPGLPDQTSRPQLSSIIEHSALVLHDEPQQQGEPVPSRISAHNSLPASNHTSTSLSAEQPSQRGGPLPPSLTVPPGAHSSQFTQDTLPTLGSSTAPAPATTSMDPKPPVLVLPFQSLGVANYSTATQSTDTAGGRRGVTGDAPTVGGEQGAADVGQEAPVSPAGVGHRGDGAARLAPPVGIPMNRLMSAGGGAPALADSLPCYHEITVIPLIDPVIDQRVLLITQTDVTNRVDVERKLAALTTAQMSMLEQMFPRHVIEHMLTAPGILSNDVSALAHDHNMVTVLFADVVGFTSMSKDSEAAAVMMFLNELYAEFDDLTLDMDVYQLDTVGDAYIVAGGLVERDEDGFQTVVTGRTREQAAQDAMNVFKFAKAMLTRAWSISMPHSGEPVALRVGIHSGRLVSGMLGTRLPKWTLFGDTMNTAARMESTCRPNCIQVSSETRTLLAEASGAGLGNWHQPLLDGEQQASLSAGLAAQEADGQWYATGGVEVKGKGKMDTWVFVLQSPDSPVPTTTPDPQHMLHVQQLAARNTPAPSLAGPPDDGGLDLAAGLMPRGRGPVARRPPRLTPVPEAQSELGLGRPSVELSSPPGSSSLVQNPLWSSANGFMAQVEEEGSEQEEEEEAQPVRAGRGAEQARPGSSSHRRSQEDRSSHRLVLLQEAGDSGGSSARRLMMTSHGSSSQLDTAAAAAAAMDPGSRQLHSSGKRLGSNSAWSVASLDKDSLSPEGSSWAISAGEVPDADAGGLPEQGSGGVSGVARKVRRPPRKTKSMLTLASLAVATAAAGASVQRPGSGVDTEQQGEAQHPTQQQQQQQQGSASQLVLRTPPPLRQISTGFSGVSPEEEAGARGGGAGSLSSGTPSRRLSHLLSSDQAGHHLGSLEAAAAAGPGAADRASRMSSSRGTRSPVVPASPMSGSTRAQTPTSAAVAAVLSSGRTASGVPVMDGFARLHNVMHSGAASAQARPPIRGNLTSCSATPPSQQQREQQTSPPGQGQGPPASREPGQDLLPGGRTPRGVTWLMDPPSASQHQHQQQQHPQVTRAASAGYLRSSGTGGGASQSTRRSGSMTLSRGSTNRTSAHRDRGSGGNSEVLLAVATALQQQQQQQQPVSVVPASERSSATDTHPNITAAAGFARGSWTEESLETGTWGLATGEDLGAPASTPGTRPPSTQHAAALRLKTHDAPATEAPISPGLIRVSYAHTEAAESQTGANPSAVGSRGASFTHQPSMSRPHSVPDSTQAPASAQGSSPPLPPPPALQPQQQTIPRILRPAAGIVSSAASAAVQPSGSSQHLVQPRTEGGASRGPSGSTSTTLPAPSRAGITGRSALQSLGNALILAGASTDTAHTNEPEHVPVMQLLAEELEEYRSQLMAGAEGVGRPGSTSGYLLPDSAAGGHHLSVRESSKAPQVGSSGWQGPPPGLGQGLWSRLAGERGSAHSRDSRDSRPSRSSMDAPGLPAFLASGSPRHPRASLGMPYGSSQLSRWTSMEMPPGQQQQQPYHTQPVSPPLQQHASENQAMALRNKRGSGGGGSSGALPSVLPHTLSRGSRSPSANSTAATSTAAHMQQAPGMGYGGATSIDSSSTPRHVGLGQAGTGSSGSLTQAAALAAMSASNANRTGSDALQASPNAAAPATTSPRHSGTGGTSSSRAQMMTAAASLDPAGSSEVREQQQASSMPRAGHLTSTMHSSGRLSPSGAAHPAAATPPVTSQQQPLAHPHVSAVRTGPRNPGSPGGSGGAGTPPVGTGRHRRTSLAVLGSLGAALGSMASPLDYPQPGGQGQGAWDEAAAAAAAVSHSRGVIRRRLEGAEGGSAASDRLPTLGSSPFTALPGSYMGAHSHSNWGDELLGSNGGGGHMPRRRGDAQPQGPLMMQSAHQSYSRPYMEDRASTRGLMPEGRESPSAPTVMFHEFTRGMHLPGGQFIMQQPNAQDAAGSPSNSNGA